MVTMIGGAVCWAAGRVPTVNVSRSPSKLLGAGKIVGGLALGSCCGPLGVYGAAYTGVGAAVFFGLVMGLGFRWVLTGAANVAGKRLNPLVGLAPVVLLVLPAYLWGPQISMKGRAEEGVRKNDAGILREVLRHIERDHADDKAFAEAREIARGGLDLLLKEATEQLKAPAGPKDGGPAAPVDEELRRAFLQVIGDLSGGDGTVYVAFRHEANVDPPAGADAVLQHKRSLPEVKEAFLAGDAPVVPPGQAFDPEFTRKRRDTFFTAMTEAFQRVFKHPGLLTLQPLADGEDRAGKFVFEVKSAAVRQPTYYTYTRQGKVAGLLFSLRTDWEFAVIDRRGRELYRKKTSSDPALNITYRSTPNDPAWAPYSVMMDSAFYNYGREVIARFGLTPPGERTEFAFAE
jgi:hypothetical protein